MFVHMFFNNKHREKLKTESDKYTKHHKKAA